MRLFLSKKTAVRTKARMKNKMRIRRKVQGTGERPRLAVYRSGRHMYAQVIDDVTGKTLAASSTLKLTENGKSGQNAAKSVGMEVAKKALALNIKGVVFDRSGYVYHGRVKAVAEGAREGGLSL